MNKTTTTGINFHSQEKRNFTAFKVAAFLLSTKINFHTIWDFTPENLESTKGFHITK